MLTAMSIVRAEILSRMRRVGVGLDMYIKVVHTLLSSENWNN